MCMEKKQLSKTVKTKTRCKCECHKLKPIHIGKKDGKDIFKKVRSPICSICMENHKRSKDYKSMKSMVEMLGGMMNRIT